MKIISSILVFAAAISALQGCGKRADQTAVAPAKASASEVVALSGVFEAAKRCINLCQTVSKVVNQDGTALKVFWLFDSKGFNPGFEALVQKLPEGYRSLVLPIPMTSEERDRFGSSQGQLIELGGDKYLIFTTVGYFQSKPKSSGSISVAIPMEGQGADNLAILLNDFDKIQLEGDEKLQSVLLANFALQSTANAKKDFQNATSNGPKDYASVKVELPASSNDQTDVQQWLEAIARKFVAGKLFEIGSHPIASAAEKARQEAAWYAPAINNNRCVESALSPADRIKSIQESGYYPKAYDRRDSTGKVTFVEIKYTHGDWTTTHVYYKSKEECEGSLPRSQPIPDGYR